MIKANINVTKIDKSHLHKGEKGTYLGLTFIPVIGRAPLQVE